MKDFFCKSVNRYSRQETTPVNVGGVIIGGGNHIIVQSMGTTLTADIKASANQAMIIADAGGEIVRFTAQGRSEAAALKEIVKELRKKNYIVPIVADVHFNREVAFIAAENVQKVRINPGNFIDKRANFTEIHYSDNEYEAELTRLKTEFTKLLNICRANNTALRIGVNHGSLSDRIMTRYGDTPSGMVASAMEFLRICKEEKFNDIVISMKSSNTQVMVRAYRMISAAMSKEEMHYPLHLGVTEAGEGEDGRIRSAVGIGALLNDGLGDTIRVSLTEAPENEIPVAKELCSYYEGRELHCPIEEVSLSCYNPYDYARKESVEVGNIGGSKVPVVVGHDLNIVNFTTAKELNSDSEYISLSLSDTTEKVLKYLEQNPTQIIINITNNINGVAEQRAFALKLSEAGIKNPIIVKRTYNERLLASLQLKASADLGMLFIDGLADGLWIENAASTEKELSELGLAILQAAARRYTKTEYISCPGCGRTLFSLQERVKEVKQRTTGLSSLKIAVMGCIVNGPGEMADADYGYVGSGAGKVSLYKGKELVKHNIDEKEALDELIALIKENGDYR